MVHFYYAVISPEFGSAIYTDWSVVKPLVEGVSGVVHRKFKTLGEAKDFLVHHGVAASIVAQYEQDMLEDISTALRGTPLSPGPNLLRQASSPAPGSASSSSPAPTQPTAGISSSSPTPSQLAAASSSSPIPPGTSPSASSHQATLDQILQLLRTLESRIQKIEESVDYLSLR